MKIHDPPKKGYTKNHVYLQVASLVNHAMAVEIVVPFRSKMLRQRMFMPNIWQYLDMFWHIPKRSQVFSWVQYTILDSLPSGNLLHSYGKIHHAINGYKSTISMAMASIAMLVIYSGFTDLPIDSMAIFNSYFDITRG